MFIALVFVDLLKLFWENLSRNSIFTSCSCQTYRVSLSTCKQQTLPNVLPLRFLEHHILSVFNSLSSSTFSLS